MSLLHNLFLKILFCTMDHTRLEEMQAHDYKNAPSKMISAHNVSPSDCFTLLDRNNDPANPNAKMRFQGHEKPEMPLL